MLTIVLATSALALNAPLISSAPMRAAVSMRMPSEAKLTRLEKKRMRGVVVPTSAPPPADITIAEVLACQAKWADSIAKISSVYLEKGDYVAAAAQAAGELYGYGHHDVLFKPTKATKHPFRATGEVAMSYFVGAEVMKMDEFKGEDAGFAINGGKGWKKVVFTNHNVALNGETAVAMGSYDFTCATTGNVATVEYTFGYKRCADGKPRIFLHHSSVPYNP